MTWMAPAYPWIKTLHILSVIAWMAGQLYLPRLYVYHAGVAIGSEASQTFKVMERRLLRGIMNPAMIATFVFGILLAGTPGVVDMHQFWLPTKVVLVLIMAFYHGKLAGWRRGFERDTIPHSAGFFRMINEVPTVLLVLIVILVVVKPF